MEEGGMEEREKENMLLEVQGVTCEESMYFQIENKIGILKLKNKI